MSEFNNTSIRPVLDFDYPIIITLLVILIVCPCSCILVFLVRDYCYFKYGYSRFPRSNIIPIAE